MSLLGTYRDWKTPFAAANLQKPSTKNNATLNRRGEITSLKDIL